MAELTPRQSEILDFIQAFIDETGMPPTRAEIARELGFRSANAAEDHLRALQRKGVLELIPGTSRGIQLKDFLREQLGLPLVVRPAYTLGGTGGGIANAESEYESLVSGGLTASSSVTAPPW